MVAWYVAATFDTVESCLQASVLSIEVVMTRCTLLSRHTSLASR